MIWPFGWTGAGLGALRPRQLWADPGTRLAAVWAMGAFLRLRLRARVTALAALPLALALMIGLHLGLSPLLSACYDMTDLGRAVTPHDAAGIAVTDGTYHVQLNFSGRLLNPVARLSDDAVAGWLRDHPGGVLLDQTDPPPQHDPCPAAAVPQQDLYPSPLTEGRAMTPDISVVLPARDEAGNITALLTGIAATLRDHAHEIIVIDDASRDGMRAELAALQTRLPQLRVICHDRSCGQSAAIRSGVWAARGALIVTLDADGQNPPDNIPALLESFAGGGIALGLVQGQRVDRRDRPSRRLASAAANGIRNALLRDGCCGLHARPGPVRSHRPKGRSMSLLITGSAVSIGITAIQGPLRCPCHSPERAWRRGPHHYRPLDTRARLARGVGMSGGDARQGLRCWTLSCW